VNTRSRRSFSTSFGRRGAQYPAYWPIVAGGANACILHYRDNDARLADGDLLLIDAGCELDGYASDVTRTFPVSGKFSGPQKDVYELVLAAQSAAIAAVKPGNGWDEPHNAAVKTLARGFVDLGLCHGTVEKSDRGRGLQSASTCIAPGIGSAWTCTTPGNTNRAGSGAASSRA